MAPEHRETGRGRVLAQASSVDRELAAQHDWSTVKRKKKWASDLLQYTTTALPQTLSPDIYIHIHVQLSK